MIMTAIASAYQALTITWASTLHVLALQSVEWKGVQKRRMAFPPLSMEASQEPESR